MTRIFKFYWPVFLWSVFVFLLCTIKLGPVSENHAFFPGFDKLVHCGFYFVWVVTFYNGFIRSNSFNALTFGVEVLVTAGAMLYGGVIELLQAYVFTWRDGDWADMFADTVGACMGTFSMLLLAAAFKYVKK